MNRQLRKIRSILRRLGFRSVTISILFILLVFTSCVNVYTIIVHKKLVEYQLTEIDNLRSETIELIGKVLDEQEEEDEEVDTMEVDSSN